MTTCYLTFDEYTEMGGNVIPQDEADRLLRNVSRDIDTLTYNRIRREGFTNLTEFQREVIKEVAFRMAEFIYDNDEMLQGALASYSINGVSMSFDFENSTVKILSGVVIEYNVFELLKQTGLCTGSFR